MRDMENDLYNFGISYDVQLNQLLLVDKVNKKARHLEFDEIGAIEHFYEDNK